MTVAALLAVLGLAGCGAGVGDSGSVVGEASTQSTDAGSGAPDATDPELRDDVRRAADRAAEAMIARGDRATTAVTRETGIVSLGDGRAQVLAFVDGTTTTRAGQSVGAEHTLLVTLVERDESWRADDLVTVDGPVAVAPEPDPGLAEIVASAGDLTDAFLDLDHRTIDRTRDRVLALASGRFAEEYEASFEQLQSLARSAGSVQRGQVLAAGVVTATTDRATVIVSALATVTNNATERPMRHLYRLQLELALVDGQWLTNDLRFIEAPS